MTRQTVPYSQSHSHEFPSPSGVYVHCLRCWLVMVVNVWWWWWWWWWWCVGDDDDDGGGGGDVSVMMMMMVVVVVMCWWWWWWWWWWQKWMDILSRKSRKPPTCELCRYQFRRHKRLKVITSALYPTVLCITWGC